MGANGSRQIALISDVARYGRARIAPLELAGFVAVDGYEYSAISDPTAFGQALGPAWGIIAGNERYNAAVFEQISGLRVIARCGTGYENIDLGAATGRGIAVLTTPAANAEAVADFAIALALASLRRLFVLDQAVRTGKWRTTGLSSDLSRSTVGIVGLGAIGKCVVRRLSGFGCRMLAVEPKPDLEFCSEWGIELATLEDLLPQVDLLTLHASLTDETRGLIGTHELSRMKPTAVLVNTARSGLVKQDELIESLKRGEIAGAALDVFDIEPLPLSHPLLGLPSVILSSHEASFTPLGVNTTIDTVVDFLLEFDSGSLPSGCVNPEVADVLGLRRQ